MVEEEEEKEEEEKEEDLPVARSGLIAMSSEFHLPTL